MLMLLLIPSVALVTISDVFALLQILISLAEAILYLRRINGHHELARLADELRRRISKSVFSCPIILPYPGIYNSALQQW